MKTFVVAVASLFKGTNTLYAIEAKTHEQAKMRAIELAGWQLADNLENTLAQIEDIVSEALEVNSNEKTK